jgi:type III secretory pathway component EscS
VIVVLCTSHLLQLANTRKFITAIATAFVAFSTALLWQYSMIWSEPPFIAVLMIGIVVSLRKMTATKFVSLTFLFIALFFIRYVGPVFAIAITAASIYFDRRQLGWLKSVAANVLALGISLIPIWLWLDRNQDIDGTLTGARVPGGGTLLSPLKTFTSTIGSWLVAKPFEGGIYLSWDSYPQNFFCALYCLSRHHVSTAPSFSRFQHFLRQYECALYLRGFFGVSIRALRTRTTRQSNDDPDLRANGFDYCDNC